MEKMEPAQYQTQVTPTRTRQSCTRIGCVSYLNAKPLVHGLMHHDADPVSYTAPADLLTILHRDQVDISLCPVIDYFRSDQPLVIIPAGAIGCDGPTLTVRLFSRIPIEEIQSVHADIESHSSVALMRIILKEMFKLDPTVTAYRIGHQGIMPDHQPQTLLMIGDKVVTHQPPVEKYPYQLDLGEAWKQLTKLPFIFAVWMSRPGLDLDNLPARLHQLRVKNMLRIDSIADHHAKAHGWPKQLARHYLGNVMRYEIMQPQFEAIICFAELAVRHGIIPAVEPLRIRAIDL